MELDRSNQTSFAEPIGSKDLITILQSTLTVWVFLISLVNKLYWLYVRMTYIISVCANRLLNSGHPELTRSAVGITHTPTPTAPLDHPHQTSALPSEMNKLEHTSPIKVALFLGWIISLPVSRGAPVESTGNLGSQMEFETITNFTVSVILVLSVVLATISVFLETHVFLNLSLLVSYIGLMLCDIFVYVNSGYKTNHLVLLLFSVVSVLFYFRVAFKYFKIRVRFEHYYDYLEDMFDEHSFSDFANLQLNRFQSLLRMIKKNKKFRSDLMYMIIMVLIFSLPRAVFGKTVPSTSTRPSVLTPISHLMTTPNSSHGFDPLWHKDTLNHDRLYRDHSSKSVHQYNATTVLGRFRERWQQRFDELDNFEFFKLLILGWFLEVIVLIICKVIFYRLFMRRLLCQVVNDNDGYILQIGNHSVWTSTHGKVHATYCANKEDEFCGCMRNGYADGAAQALLKIATSSKKDHPNAEKDRGRIKISGTIYQVFFFLFMVIEECHCFRTDLVTASPANAFIVITYIAMFLSLVGIFYRTILFMCLSTMLIAVSLLGLAITEEISTTSRDMIIIATSISLAIILVFIVAYVCRQIRKTINPRGLQNQVHDLESERRTASGLPKATKQIKHRGAILGLSSAPKRLPYASVLFVILLLTLGFALVESTSITCHGKFGDSKVRACYDTYGEPYHDVIDMADMSIRLESLYQKMKGVTTLHIPALESVTSSGSRHICTKVTMSIAENGTMYFTTRSWGRIANTNLKYNASAIVLAVSWTLKEYYLDHGCKRTSITPSYAEGYCNAFFCINKYDYLLLQEFAVRDPLTARFADRESMHTRNKRLVGAWSYYSHQAEYCTHCVSLESFNKWKADTESTINNLILGSRHLSKALNKTNSIQQVIANDLHSVGDYVDSVDAKLTNLQFAVYESERQFYRMLAMRSVATQAIRQYNGAYQTFQNLLSDAAGPGKPVLSKEMVIGAIEKSSSKMNYTLDDESIQLILAKDVLIVKFTLMKSCRVPDVDFSAFYCVSRSNTALYMAQNLKISYISASHLLSITTVGRSNNEFCYGTSCMFKYNRYFKNVQLNRQGISQIELINWSFEDEHFFEEVTISLFRIDNSLLGVCAGICKVYCDSRETATIQNNVKLIASCPGVTSISNDVAEVIATDPASKAIIDIPDSLPDFYFPPSPVNPGYKHAPVKLHDLSSELNDVKKLVRQSDDYFKTADYFEQKAENDTVDNGGVHTPDFIKGITGVVDAVAGGAVSLIDGIASFPAKLLSSTALSVLPFILSGVAVAISIFWPIFLIKIVMKRQNKYKEQSGEEQTQ